MATNFPTPPTRTISWQSEVLASDPTYQLEQTKPIIYQFSNSREFRRNPNPYTSSN